MLDLAYDEAPYLILSYDDELHAHRTDRFASWTVQPRDLGTSLFTYGVQGYLDLVSAETVATASPSVSAAPSPLPTATPTQSPAPAGGVNLTAEATTSLLIVAGVVVSVMVVGLVATRIRRRTRP